MKSVLKNSKKIKTVDVYIASFPKEIRVRLTAIRSLIKKIAPRATEVIGYGMPGYKLNGSLVYFAAFKNHIGLYAMPSVQGAFKKELAKYKTSKGTVQFQHDKPLPISLIAKIVKFRVKENEAHAKK